MVSGRSNNIKVAPQPTIHAVSTATAGENVVAGIAGEDVIQCIAGGVDVTNTSQGEVFYIASIGAGTIGIDQAVADRTHDSVRAFACQLRELVACIVDDVGVIPIPTFKVVGAGSAIQRVIAAQPI